MLTLALLPLAVVVLGFAARQHPARVVLLAMLTAGLVALPSVSAFLELVGTQFLKARYLLVLMFALPVIAILERHGLRALAAQLVRGWKGVRTGRLLLAYLALRQGSAALGLTSLGGHAQMVRPLVAPMAEAADGDKHGEPPSTGAQSLSGPAAQAPVVRIGTRLSAYERRSSPPLTQGGNNSQSLLGENLTQLARNGSDRNSSEEVRALAAATDNVGLFFGEDLFLAFGAVLLMQAFFAERGIELTPLSIALWGIPTAILAFVIHGARLLWRDRRR